MSERDPASFKERIADLEETLLQTQRELGNMRHFRDRAISERDAARRDTERFKALAYLYYCCHQGGGDGQRNDCACRKCLAWREQTDAARAAAPEPAHE